MCGKAFKPTLDALLRTSGRATKALGAKSALSTRQIREHYDPVTLPAGFLGCAVGSAAAPAGLAGAWPAANSGMAECPADRPAGGCMAAVSVARASMPLLHAWVALVCEMVWDAKASAVTPSAMTAKLTTSILPFPFMVLCRKVLRWRKYPGSTCACHRLHSGKALAGQGTVWPATCALAVAGNGVAS